MKLTALFALPVVVALMQVSANALPACSGNCTSTADREAHYKFNEIIQAKKLNEVGMRATGPIFVVNLLKVTDDKKTGYTYLVYQKITEDYNEETKRGTDENAISATIDIVSEILSENKEEQKSSYSVIAGDIVEIQPENPLEPPSEMTTQKTP
jgi:hypothetical protein